MNPKPLPPLKPTWDQNVEIRRLGLCPVVTEAEARAVIARCGGSTWNERQRRIREKSCRRKD